LAGGRGAVANHVKLDNASAMARVVFIDFLGDKAMGWPKSILRRRG
jgi:hypothetical protein